MGLAQTNQKRAKRDWNQTEEPAIVFMRLLIAASFAAIAYYLIDWQWPHDFAGVPYVVLFLIPFFYGVFTIFNFHAVHD